MANIREDKGKERKGWEKKDREERIGEEFGFWEKRPVILYQKSYEYTFWLGFYV